MVVALFVPGQCARIVRKIGKERFGRIPFVVLDFFRSGKHVVDRHGVRFKQRGARHELKHRTGRVQALRGAVVKRKVDAVVLHGFPLFQRKASAQSFRSNPGQEVMA